VDSWGNRHHVFGDEFGSTAQAACFIIFYKKCLFHPFEEVFFIFYSLLEILAIFYLDCQEVFFFSLYLPHNLFFSKP